MPFDRRRGGSLMLMRGGFPYLLRDEFLTDQAAPLSSPRTAEPGPGQVTLFDDASGRWQIVDGILGLTASATAGFPPPHVRGAAITRATGLAMKARVAQNPQGASGTAAFSPVMGWANDETLIGAVNTVGLYFAANANFLASEPGQTSAPNLLGAYVAETFYDFICALRSTGAFSIRDDRLMWVHKQGSDATLWPFVGQSDLDRHTPEIDYLRVGRLGGPWTDDYGIVTQRLAGARSVNDTFVHEAGAQWVEFVLTSLPSAGSITIDIRRLSADNRWTLEVLSDGTFRINRVLNGTPAASVQSIPGNQAGDRLLFVGDGTAFRLMRWRSGAAVQSSISTPTNFTTTAAATEGEVTSLGTGGAISDLETWPRVLSGSALDWINRL